MELKERIREHWEQEVCGHRNGLGAQGKEYFDNIDRERYRQEPMIHDFARFEESKGRKVLEVGLGTGADFIRWVRAGAEAYGRDLTRASVETVGERLRLEGLTADVAQGDAEKLEFPDNTFDIYYSWGVLMATPDINAALREAHRVLKPGGVLRIMLYHYPSVGAYLVWLRHSVMALKMETVKECYYHNVESPGMKLYSVNQASGLVSRHFGKEPEVRTYLGAGDLLTHNFSDKYRGLHWKAAKLVYPRRFVRHVIGDRFGTEMTMEVTK
ncbi:MAG TPA: class I SAM-dependent methyltransferase [Pyrinomonadaceae bacterium]|nr:class I SAM-dependent methyltransferase [Pyrinomonadaceae bacterium]